MEIAGLKSVEKIRTTSLDQFVSQQETSPIDFIKIDIQGAEIDVFRGDENSLTETVAIAREVEVIRLYED